MVFGKEFYNIGPTTENDLEAKCLSSCFVGPPRIYDLC